MTFNDTMEKFRYDLAGESITKTLPAMTYDPQCNSILIEIRFDIFEDYFSFQHNSVTMHVEEPPISLENGNLTFTLVFDDDGNSEFELTTEVEIICNVTSVHF